MSYRPRHQPQLGRGTVCPGRSRGASDCGPRAAQVGMDEQTKGRLKPGPQELRQRSNNQGCTTNTNTYRYYNSNCYANEHSYNFVDTNCNRYGYNNTNSNTNTSL